ncbi:MAG TPA: hypothetical protein VG538_06105 [Vicinamibacterales bacterium]|jgi:hypothetical protein|nr:hypothetical protein [Vicinamibacterales bacterium]
MIALIRRELDAHTLTLLAGLGLIGYGAALLHPAAGFLAPGAILVWWTLPSRPPFVARSTEPKERR